MAPATAAPLRRNAQRSKSPFPATTSGFFHSCFDRWPDLVSMVVLLVCQRSVRERIGAKLESHDLGPVCLAALEVEHGSSGKGRPQRPALPARARIVDAPFGPFGEEADRIWNAQAHELALHQREHRVVEVAGGHRHVLSEAERIELVHPGVIARLGAARIRHALELRSGQGIKRPALGAVLAGRGRTVEDLALAAVELSKMAARERGPEDAVAIDVAAARPVTGERRL